MRPLSQPRIRVTLLAGVSVLAFLPGVGSLSASAATSLDVVHTIAGNGQTGSTGDGGPATAATFVGPETVAANAAGDVFVGDRRANKVRKISRDGTVTTYAGTGDGGSSGDGGPASQATFYGIWDIAVDRVGNVYVRTGGPQGSLIRKVDLAGIITTIAGVNAPRADGGTFDDGTCTTPPFETFCDEGHLATQTPIFNGGGLAVDSGGNVYYAEQQRHRVRRVDTSGIVRTIAGTKYDPRKGYVSGSNGPDVSAEASLFNLPYRLTVDTHDNVYVVDHGNRSIRRIGRDGRVTLALGKGCRTTQMQQQVCVALFSDAPIAVDATGALYTAVDSQLVRSDNSGVTVLSQGNTTLPNNGDGAPARLANLGSIKGLSFGPDGTLYVADYLHHQVRALKPGLIPALDVLN